MLERLCGVASPLWLRWPEMALTLLVSIPSGNSSIVEARSDLIDLLFHSFHNPISCVIPSRVIHSSSPVMPVPPSVVYVGFGSIDLQNRPSIYCNPFLFLDSKSERCAAAFEDYLDSRADVVEFLTPLAGKTLLCDCSEDSCCHAYVLSRYLSDLFFGPDY